MNIGNRFYSINKVFDEKGILSVATLQHDVPFTVKRIFWITKIPNGIIRGKHAHKTCHELLFVLNGSMTLTIGDTDFLMNPEANGIAIWAGEWCELKDFAPNTVILVLASEDYDATGYINSYEEYLNWLK